MSAETASQQLYREACLIKKTKVKIASLCHQIIENPEANVDRIAEILRFLETIETCSIREIRRLTALSLCELFCDILPSYRIRQLTEKEKSQKAKKETKKLQTYEEKLITHYKKFTTIIAKMIREQPLVTAKGKVSVPLVEFDEKTGVKCAGTLLVSHPSFNYSEDLMKMLVPILNYNSETLKSKTKRSTLDLTQSFIHRLFREDRSGEATLTLTRGIVQFSKSKSYQVEPSILDVLLHLNVKEVARNEEQSRRLTHSEKKAKWSRKQRKDDKKNFKFNKEMEETRISQTRDSRLRINSKIIAQVFLLYFKVLQLAEYIDPKLLSAVLTGLSKHAHLLSVEFFDDMFATFNQLLSTNSLTPSDSVACVHTAMTVLSGQGEALEVDPRRFYNHLYSQLLPAVTHDSGAPLQQILDCLEIMLVKRRRQVSIDRSLAFMKRLATCALHATSTVAAYSILHFLHRLLRQEPRAAAVLLDADCEKGQGCYDPDATEPEFSNASSAALWELLTLRRHISPEVRSQADLTLQALTVAAPVSRKKEGNQEAGEGGGNHSRCQAALLCVEEAERSLASPEVQRIVSRKGIEGRKRKLKGRAEPEWLQKRLKILGIESAPV